MATTLEILAPYLPYGIEVLWRTTSNGKPMAPYATSLKGYLPGSGYAVQRKGDIQRWAADEEILPLLRPFSALADPLPDGTIPAIEFAKICLGEDTDLEDESAFYDGPDEDEDEDGDTHETEETIEVRGVDFYDNGKRIIFTIYPDWTWYSYGDGDNCAPAAAIDYLRSKHFAVGLQPHQFAPVAAPTKEGGQS